MRRLSMILCTALVLLLLFPAAGCAQKLAAEFDESAVSKKAAAVLDLITENNTELLLADSTVALQQALTDEVMDQVYAVVAEAGEFEGIVETRMYGSKDKASGEEFAVAIVTAQYEHKKLIYTLSFTKQMKLAGLYYR